MEAVLRYTIMNGMTGEDISSYINQLSGDIPEYEDLMGTIAQQFIQQGAERERQVSLEREKASLERERQASLERERQTLLKAARALLDNGVSLEVVIKSTGLSREELEQLRH
ncbi:hypothetical protein J4198_004756 [Salmonella enterica]|nr:hypothetical protein [Salmonella enterica]